MRIDWYPDVPQPALKVFAECDGYTLWSPYIVAQAFGRQPPKRIKNPPPKRPRWRLNHREAFNATPTGERATVWLDRYARSRWRVWAQPEGGYLRDLVAVPDGTWAIDEARQLALQRFVTGSAPPPVRNRPHGRSRPPRSEINHRGHRRDTLVA